jgi:hypothetical protein
LMRLNFIANRYKLQFTWPHLKAQKVLQDLPKSVAPYLVLALSMIKWSTQSRRILKWYSYFLQVFHKRWIVV